MFVLVGGFSNKLLLLKKTLANDIILVASCISFNVLFFSRFKLQFLWNTSILGHTNLWKFYDSCSLSNVLELWDQNSEFVDKSHELVPKFCTDSHRTWMEWMMMAFPWSILWNVAGLMWGNSTKTDKPQEWYRSLVSSRIGRKVGQSWRHQLCDRLIKKQHSYHWTWTLHIRCISIYIFMINAGISGVPIRIFVGRSEFGSALTMGDLKISEILLGDVVGTLT